jgi:enoyl-CoA hydratase/carnithine racemase
LDYSKYPALKVERAGNGITILKFNQPEQLNAFGGTMHRQIEDVFVDLTDDPETNIIVVTGEGKAFSAGGNVKGMAEDAGTEKGWQHVTTIFYSAKRIIENILNCPKPTIAAINGDAMGLGASVALACDVQVIAETARIADTHVRVGLVAGDGGTVLWPLLIGPNRAKDMLMRGKIIKGIEAQQMGLVNYVTPVDQVVAKALEIAADMNSMPPLAVRWTKVSVNKMVKQQFNLVADAAIAYEMLTMVSQDHKEAAWAFVEKRKPTFKGI